MLVRILNKSFSCLLENLKTKNKVSDDAQNSNNNTLNSKLLTKQERNYFIKLFPESKEIIEKHILFNRNAKIQNIETFKGIYIDGKI